MTVGQIKYINTYIHFKEWCWWRSCFLFLSINSTKTPKLTMWHWPQTHLYPQNQNSSRILLFSVLKNIFYLWTKTHLARLCVFNKNGGFGINSKQTTVPMFIVIKEHITHVWLTVVFLLACQQTFSLSCFILFKVCFWWKCDILTLE